MPVSEPVAFPMFCTLRLSPRQGGSPAWKPADSFQSCKTPESFSSQGYGLLCTLPSCLPKLRPDFTPSLQRERAGAASLAGSTMGTSQPSPPGLLGGPQGQRSPGQGGKLPRQKGVNEGRPSRLWLSRWQGIREPRSVLLPGYQWIHQAMPGRRQIYQLSHMDAIHTEPFPA